MSPDIWDFEPEYADEVSRDWLIRLLMTNTVRLALGHFSKRNPDISAKSIEAVVTTATECDVAPRGVRVFTDHMLNDMPQRITHAFRTEVSRSDRAEKVKEWRVDDWGDPSTLNEILGPVPATLMTLAKQGKIVLSINFDGDHVDRELALAITDHVGHDNVCLMTDRCERDSLAGQNLTLGSENTLLYQAGGIVAAGTKGVLQQISELLRHDVSGEVVNRLVGRTPEYVLAI